MKKIIVFFLLFRVCGLKAQQPEFQYTLLVEDARGNIDSVVLGYDKSSTSITPSSGFGEIDIKSRPFDSILEVRATKANNRFSITFHSKKIIARTEVCATCTPIRGASSIITLLIRAKYYPLKFKWNKSLFVKKTGSFLVSSETYFTYDPTLTQYADSLYQTAYLANQSEKTELFNKRTPGGEPNPSYYYAFTAPINNGRNDTIWTYSTVFRFEQSVGIRQHREQEINGFPNPCFDELTVEIPNYESGQIEVFDIVGRKVKSIKVESINQFKMDVKDLNHGLYLLKFKTNTDKVYVSKFVKS